MEVKLERRSAKFQPIDMTLTFESENEVREAWHRFNINLMDILKRSARCLPLSVEYVEQRCRQIGAVWNTLNNEVDPGAYVGCTFNPAYEEPQAEVQQAQSFGDTIKQMHYRGQRIQAIKAIRAEFHCGLREAKRISDILEGREPF